VISKRLRNTDLDHDVGELDIIFDGKMAKILKFFFLLLFIEIWIIWINVAA